MPNVKPKCEVRLHRSCSGRCVTLVTGTRKGDPVFYCCLGCRADLSMSGVRLKDAPAGSASTSLLPPKKKARVR